MKRANAVVDPAYVRADQVPLSAHHRRVHEGGCAIRKDHAGRWYFRRPDGRAVPACGYRREDVIDDDIDRSNEPAGMHKNGAIHPSAEGFSADRRHECRTGFSYAVEFDLNGRNYR